MIKSTFIDDQEIEYLDIGKGQPLIFLHGAFGSFRFYKPLLTKLAIKYRVIAPVLPGMGNSAKIKVKSDKEILPYYLHILKNFINKIINTNDYLLLGHSLGGYLGLKLVTEYNLKPQKIITINSPSHSLTHYYVRTIKGWSGVTIEHLRNIKNIGLKNLIPYDVVNMLIKRPGQFYKVFKSLNSIEALKRGKEKLTSLIIFSSENDTYVPHEHAINLALIYPEARLISIKNGGHAWFYYNDKALIKELINKKN